MITVVAVIVMNQLPEIEKLIGIAVIATITFVLMLYVTGNYFTRGYYVGEKSLKLVDGNFGRRILIVKYPKIQFVETKQSPLAKYFHIQKGRLYLLASTKNRVHNIPYFPEKETEVIRRRILR